MKFKNKTNGFDYKLCKKSTLFTRNVLKSFVNMHTSNYDIKLFHKQAPDFSVVSPIYYNGTTMALRLDGKVKQWGVWVERLTMENYHEKCSHLVLMFLRKFKNRLKWRHGK